MRVYINRDTTITIGGSQNNGDKIHYHMPSFVLCAEKPYIDNKKLLHTLQEFENNTVDPQQHLFDFFMMEFTDTKVSV